MVGRVRTNHISLLGYARDDRTHLRRSNSRRQIVSRGGREQAVVVDDLADTGDVVEVARVVEIVEQVQQRIGIAGPLVLVTVAICDDAGPELLGEDG